MSNNILFVSENYMRTQFFISDDVDGKYILQSVRTAQDLKYQTVIGQVLYEKLQTLVSSGDISKSENIVYKNLINASQMFIGFSAIVQLAVVTTVKISNIGLNRTSDEDVEVLQNKEMFEIVDYYQHQADFYQKQLQDYLLENYQDIPELSETDYYKIKANLYSSASSNLWLGGARGRGRYSRDHWHIGYDKP